MNLARFAEQLKEIIVQNPGLDLDAVPVVVSTPSGDDLAIEELSVMDDEDGEYGGEAIVYVELKEY